MFGTKTSRLLTFLSVLALIGCGGGDEGETTTTSEDEHAGGEHHHGGHHGEHHGEGHGEGHADHHSEAPPTVVAFHDVLAPVWHAEEGTDRPTAACAAVADLRTAAAAVTDAETPAEIAGTPEDWSGATGGLAAAVETLGTSCEESPDDVDGQLSNVHDAFHALTEQLPGHGH